MFCANCGKEIDSTWVKCPYCGNTLTTNQSQENIKPRVPVSSTPIVNGNYTSDTEMLKKKKKWPFVIVGVIIAIIGIIFLFLSDNGPSEVVELSSYEGGFLGWERSGFKGSVRADIEISYPLLNTERNNYAVFIGIGGINTGVIMQKDEAPVSQWEWLMNAQPDMITQAYYFIGTLTYTGIDAGDMPLFVIEDVEPYTFYSTGEATGDNTDISNEVDNSSYVYDDVWEDEISGIAVEDFSGWYMMDNGWELYIEPGYDYPSDDLPVYADGWISISYDAETFMAVLCEDGTNEYAIWLEAGNTVIGRLMVIDTGTVIIMDSDFNGVYEMLERHET